MSLLLCCCDDDIFGYLQTRKLWELSYLGGCWWRVVTDQCRRFCVLRWCSLLVLLLRQLLPLWLLVTIHSTQTCLPDLPCFYNKWCVVVCQFAIIELETKNRKILYIYRLLFFVFFLCEYVIYFSIHFSTRLTFELKIKTFRIVWRIFPVLNNTLSQSDPMAARVLTWYSVFYLSTKYPLLYSACHKMSLF